MSVYTRPLSHSLSFLLAATFFLKEQQAFECKPNLTHWLAHSQSGAYVLRPLAKRLHAEAQTHTKTWANLQAPPQSRRLPACGEKRKWRHTHTHIHLQCESTCNARLETFSEFTRPADVVAESRFRTVFALGIKFLVFTVIQYEITININREIKINLSAVLPEIRSAYTVFIQI